jgi:small multidrug resistance pump
VAYLFLSGAILSEIIATSLLKSTDGFSRIMPTSVCLVLYGVAFLLLAKAVASGMQVGVGYALWSAVGTTIIVAVGVVFLGEPMTAVKVAGISLVIAGAVTLNLASAH